MADPNRPWDSSPGFPAGVTANAIALQSGSSRVLSYLSSLSSLPSLPPLPLTNPESGRHASFPNQLEQMITLGPLDHQAVTQDAYADIERDLRMHYLDRINQFESDVLSECAESERHVVTNLISRLKVSLFSESLSAPTDSLTSSTLSLSPSPSLSPILPPSPSPTLRQVPSPFNPSLSSPHLTNLRYNSHPLPTRSRQFSVPDDHSTSTSPSPSQSPSLPSFTSSPLSTSPIQSRSSAVTSTDTHAGTQAHAHQPEMVSLKLRSMYPLKYASVAQAVTQRDMLAEMDEILQEVSDSDLCSFFSKGVRVLSSFLDKNLNYSLIRSLLRCGRFQTVQVLLKQGYPVDVRSAEGEYPAHWMLRFCAENRSEGKEIEYFLFRNIVSGLDLFADARSCFSLLQLALQTCDAQFLEIVLTCHGAVDCLSASHCQILLEEIISMQQGDGGGRLARTQLKMFRAILSSVSNEQFRLMNTHSLLAQGARSFVFCLFSISFLFIVSFSIWINREMFFFSCECERQ